MPFTINKVKNWPTLVTMGKANKVLAPETNQTRGRKAMAEEEKMGHKTGVEKISQEDAGKQGPVGSQRSEPVRELDSDVKLGNNKEEKKNG